MGDYIYWLTELASRVRLAHVIVKYNKTPIIDRYKVGSVKGSPTLESYWEKTIGVDIDLQSSSWARVRILWAYFAWPRKRPLAEKETLRPRK